MHYTVHKDNRVGVCI